MIIVLNIIFFAMQDFAESTNKVQRRVGPLLKRNLLIPRALLLWRYSEQKRRGKFLRVGLQKYMRIPVFKTFLKKYRRSPGLLQNAKKPIGKIGVGSRVKNLCKWK